MLANRKDTKIHHLGDMSAKDLRLPPPARPGDLVAIAATSRPVNAQQIQTAVKLWESAGYRVKCASNIGEVEHVFAGTLARRRKALQTLLDDPEVRVIHFAKGGYGVHQIIDDLDWSIFRQSPKWLVGFSDLTLLLAQVQALGVAAVHGPMAACFESPERDGAFMQLQQAVAGAALSCELEALYLPNNGDTTLEGQLTGGNLSLLQTTLGTSLSKPLQSADLLLNEEVDEYVYAIDRMLHHLAMSGVFDNKRAIIVGGLDWMKDNPESFGCTAHELFAQLGQRYHLPVFLSDKHGHGQQRWPLLLGVNTVLRKNDAGRWLLLQQSTTESA